MTKTEQKKLNNAVIIRLMGMIEYGAEEAPATIKDLDVWFGTEGPGSWTRIKAVSVRPAHVRAAEALLAKKTCPRSLAHFGESLIGYGRATPTVLANGC